MATLPNAVRPDRIALPALHASASPLEPGPSGHPAFFDEVPRIFMYDPLAELLGAARGGRIEYGYLDVVKLAGHSCPTVAGAYLMALKGLEALFEGELPERGAISVALAGGRAEGTVGVVANVVGMITGAAGEEGFKGLGGRFARCGLVEFDAPLTGELRLAARGRAVEVAISEPPPAAELRQKLGAALQPEATPAARHALGQEFQRRVRALLVERRDDPALVRVTRV